MSGDESGGCQDAESKIKLGMQFLRFHGFQEIRPYCDTERQKERDSAENTRGEERKALYNEYYMKEKDVMTGVVQRYLGRNVSINLGRVDAPQ